MKTTNHNRLTCWKPYHAILPSGIVYDARKRQASDTEPPVFRELFGESIADKEAREGLLQLYCVVAFQTTTAIGRIQRNCK